MSIDQIINGCRKASMKSGFFNVFTGLTNVVVLTIRLCKA